MAAAKSLTPEQLSTRGSIAGNTRWKRTGAAAREANGQRGQAGLRARLEAEVRENTPGLTDAEYERCAENAYKAHMARLAYASSRARSARKTASGTA